MKLVEISFNNMIGNSVEFRNTEQLKELVELFAKKLKLKKYSYSVYNLEIHLDTVKYSYSITEKRTNKFIIVTEDNYGVRKYSYMELVK